MVKRTGTRALNLDVPVDLFDMYSKLCIDLGITKKDGIIQYLEYLQKQYYKHRQALNEDSPRDFKLDARKPR